MQDRSKTRKVLGYYWHKAKAYPAPVIGILLVLPLTILANNYLPTLVLANVLNRLSGGDYQAHDIWASFGLQIIVYVGALFTGMVLWRVIDKFAWQLEAQIQKDIAEEVLDHLLDESVDFHANNFTGSLVSHTNKLMNSYVRVADTTIFQTYPMLAGILIVALILGRRAPIYVAGMIISSVLFIWVAFRVARPVRDLGAKTARLESRQTGFLADAITNVVAVKSFARGKYERRRFAGATREVHDSVFQLAKAHKRQMRYLGALSRSISGLALVIAIVGVIVFHDNIATVFLIFTYTAGLADQLFSFSNNSLRNYNRSVGDAIDMVETLEQTPRILDPARPEKVRISSGALEFKDVEFDHESDNPKAKPLFKGFSLVIKPGEKIGLVGHSGGGKTTLTKLILRFMDVKGGQILIDGQNIASITQDDLRSNVAYVPQEPLLFHRTLAENINYGKPKAGKAEILRAAGLAHADDFIKELPQGYETLVGERGVKLSGGQRQRIAIARAMLKDAPILVLDEATSALDSESEKLIQDALWKLMEGKTTVAIAHRLSTIQHMDRIVVLEEGRIAEQGTHKELLARKGVYARLWAHQSGGFLED